MVPETYLPNEYEWATGFRILVTVDAFFFFYFFFIFNENVSYSPSKCHILLTACPRHTCAIVTSDITFEPQQFYVKFKVSNE